jgi:aspartyl-tRNA synthetase
VKVEKPITGCTQSTVELSIKSFFVVSASEPKLPLQIEDASRPVVEHSEGDSANQLATVNLDTRLDNR